MKTTPAGREREAGSIPQQASVSDTPKQECGTKVIKLDESVSIGGKRVVLFAGPCAIETLDQLEAVAKVVADAGVPILRGGIFKLRTSPNSFQGLGEKGFKLAKEVCDRLGLSFITEAVDEASLELVAEHADMVQIGTRNMHNYALLKRAGKCKVPILLKRGFAATIDELLSAADYILQGGNERVMLCERGIRTFNTYCRYTLDLNLIPALRERTDLPVVVDVSHGTGNRKHAPQMALAAIAAGADGVMVEIHNAPDQALSDGPQSMHTEDFPELVVRMRAVAEAVGRSL